MEKFFHSFESIVNKHSLSPYEKLVYLRGQLKGAPRVLVESLDSNHQTYEKAKSLLSQAFASTITQKYEVIERLSKLRMTVSKDPYEFIGDIRSISSTFESLSITVEEVIQFFVWYGMNDKFQAQLIQITNQCKPTLEQINAVIFEAAERYLRSAAKNKSENVQKEWEMRKPHTSLSLIHI